MRTARYESNEPRNIPYRGDGDERSIKLFDLDPSQCDQSAGAFRMERLQLRNVRILEVARLVRLQTANTLDDGLQLADGVLHRAHLAFMGVFSERHRRHELVEVENGILHFGHRTPVGRGVLHHFPDGVEVAHNFWRK